VYEDQGLDVDFIIGTFSKSVGTVGGFCVSPHPKFEAIRLACRPYIFTASLPPSVVATAAASIRKLMTATAKRTQLWDNARALHGGLKAMGFRLGTDTPQSAIVAVILEDQEQAVAMWQTLIEAGLYVNVARPPATPSGTFLLRCSLCAEHTPAQIERVLTMFRAAGQAVGVIG
jgi:8-amino-7-oxononanoate synthase